MVRPCLLPLLVLASASGLPAAETPGKPNIVLILADDLGYGDVGWHGGPYQTPLLDALAKASVRLGQHYSLPVCSPTRSALLSGRFNSRFGCTNPTNDRVYPFDTTTLASAEPLPARDHSATLKVRAVSSVPHLLVYRKLAEKLAE